MYSISFNIQEYKEIVKISQFLSGKLSSREDLASQDDGVFCQ